MERSEALQLVASAFGRPQGDLVCGVLSAPPGRWHFDEPPLAPPGVVPVWRGFLVFGGRGPMAFRLDHHDLVQPGGIPVLAGRISPEELATVLSRYSRSAVGLSSHQNAIADPRRFIEEIATLDRSLVPPIGSPCLEVATDGVTTLSFSSWGIELHDDRAPSVAMTQWRARWSEREPVSVMAEVSASGLRHARYSAT